MSYTGRQVLKYIKRIHKDGFSLDSAVLNHAEWELENIPLSDLKIADDDDPYNRVLSLNYDHVDNITKHDILNKAIVVDERGHILDGNHRAARAEELGMTHIPAFVPTVDPDNETYDQFMKRIKTTESTEPGEYVYHASYLPDQQQGLKSVLMSGLKPSKDGYAGPGVYFAYDPEGGFYHVDKEDATMFRARWSDLVNKFGKYPDNENGIQRDENEIIVPGRVPANLLEVEYFPGEWWDLASAYEASKGPVDEAVIDNKEGAGAVPYNQDVDYFGMRVSMKPSVFLKLALPLGAVDNASMEKYIRGGGAIGAPFLDVAVPPEWDEGNFTKMAKIVGHEGRHRMKAIYNVEGDVPTETHIFVKYYRARELTPEFKQHIQDGIISQGGSYVHGPLFDLNINEAVELTPAPADNPVKKFIADMYAKYQAWPMDNNQRVMVWGSGEEQQFAVFELKPSFSKKNSVEVSWFAAYPLRQGVGTRAMKELQDQARAAGVGLTLFPWDKGQVSQAKLTKFYKGQGFKPINKGGKAMAWEQVSEAFDQPYPITWENSDADESMDALARLPDGSNLSIMFNQDYDDEGEGSYSVEFWRNNSQEVTGEGDQQRVFATVLAAIKQFIEKKNPQQLYFSANKEVEDGQKSHTRSNLYTSLVKRYARAMGYEADVSDFSGSTTYKLHRMYESINEGGWASTATQNTVITPAVVKEAVGILNQFADEFNVWQTGQNLGMDLTMGKPVGSGTYYERDLAQDPEREYGDIDVACYITSLPDVTAAQRTAEYRTAIQAFCQHNTKYSTENGTNVIMDTTAGPIQVDLILTFHEHANWARALAPEYRVKGAVSTSLTSAMAEVLNLSFGLQGVQTKLRAGRPVSFRQSKDTVLRSVTIDPENWGADIFKFYYTLAHGTAPETTPGNLEIHRGLKDEQRIGDIIKVIHSLAQDLESANLLGTGALDYISNAKDMLSKIAAVYVKKIDAIINSSKFDKAETPASRLKAAKTKEFFARYRDEVAKLVAI